MATIQDYLDLIKNAIYGKDVRQAIHDGIQQCYYDGQAGSTDLEARQRLDSAEGSISSLGSRMSTAEGNIDTLDARVDQIVAPSGEAPSSAEVADGRIVDGVTYNLIGDAIRAVNTNLKSDITQNRSALYEAVTAISLLKDVEETLLYTIFSGERRQTSVGGNPVTSPNTICTEYKIKTGAVKIVFGSGYKGLVAYFDSNGSYLGSTGSYTTDAIVFNTSCSYYAVEVRKTDNSNFPVSEFDYSKLTIINNAISNEGLREIQYNADYSKNRVDINGSDIVEAKNDFPINYNFASYLAPYTMPDEAFAEYGIGVYTDGKNFTTDFNIEAHKTATLRTIYLSPNGNDYNDGLSEDTPKKSLRSMQNDMLDGDTYIFLDGMYTRETLPTNIKKNVNLIAQHKGAVIITGSDNNYEYSAVSGYNNVWKTARSNVQSALFKINDDTFIPLVSASTLASLASTPMSFMQSGSDVYINVGGFTPTNDNVFLNLNTGAALVIVDSSTQNVTLYIEGITFIGGTDSTVNFANSSSYKDSVLYAKDCSFFGASGSDSNAVSLLGCDSYLVNCKAGYARRDGFNYHANNDTKCKNFELNCFGYCNGVLDTNNNNNGSTSHDGCTVFRINGTYYGNRGPNISDIAASVGGASLNMKCVAFDSIATQDAMNNDVRNGDDMETWLLGCKFLGSKYNLYNPTGSVMNISNTIYQNKGGGGTYNE